MASSHIPTTVIKQKRSTIDLLIPDSSKLVNGARLDFLLDLITNELLYETSTYYGHANHDDLGPSITWSKPPLNLTSDFFDSIESKPETYFTIKLPTINVFQYKTGKNCLTITVGYNLFFLCFM